MIGRPSRADSGEQAAPRPLFVEWDGHWYGVPNALVQNMRRAGLTVRTTPPVADQSATLTKQDDTTKE